MWTTTACLRTVLTVGLVLALYGCSWSRAVNHTRCGEVGPRLETPSEAPRADEINVLLLSAGGPWGGFGVGFLEGWSSIETPIERQRPQFHIAIGVSTGAIMVTHAFLGPEYDAVLRKRMLAVSTPDVFERRSVFVALLANSVTDTAPLRRIMEEVITEREVDAVAQAWIREGRRLAVIAVDLDCGDPTVLDLTAVCSSHYAQRTYGPVSVRRTAWH